LRCSAKRRPHRTAVQSRRSARGASQRSEAECATQDTVRPPPPGSR
jgi:hypothetical protein